MKSDHKYMLWMIYISNEYCSIHSRIFSTDIFNNNCFQHFYDYILKWFLLKDHVTNSN